MASAVTDLEIKLNDIFGKKTPQLPKNVKDFLVRWAPFISLAVGLLGLLSALSLWRWAHATNAYVDFAESTCVRYGGVNCGVLGQSRLTFWIWLSLIALMVQSFLYLLAYPKLKERAKRGWDYLYYASLVSVAVAVLRLFAGYNAFANFFFGLIGVAVGFYFLFQLRDYYTDAARVAPVATPPAETPNETIENKSAEVIPVADIQAKEHTAKETPKEAEPTTEMPVNEVVEREASAKSGQEIESEPKLLTKAPAKKTSAKKKTTRKK